MNDLINAGLVILILIEVAWLGAAFNDYIQGKVEAEQVLLWEGDAGWFPVLNIENENIILKKKLDDLQAHYDSMVCYRPGGN